MKADQIKLGMTVSMSGYVGTVVRVCEWSRNGDEVMVEIRLASGIGCYSCTSLEIVKTV